MERKVFISILGTGFYDKCKYVSDNFCSTETRFAQQAVLESFKANEWSKNSACYIFCTEKAFEYNWNVSERIKHLEKEPQKYTGLKTILDNMQFSFEPQSIKIPDGKNESEMWDIFDIIFDLLKENDELYIDLTHSFRYLPMLLLVLSNYSKFLKNVKIKHLSYGNFEARDREKNEAPIVDLLPISALQDWTFAAADYLENGNVERLKDLSISSLTPILMETKGKDVAAIGMKKLIQSLQDATDDFQTCRGMNIVNSENINCLKENIGKAESTFIKPLQPVIKKIEESFLPFDRDKNINNGFHAAQWCFNNGLYQQAATILQENIVSYFCKKHDIEIDNENRRRVVNRAFFICGNKISESEWDEKKEEVETIKKLTADTELNRRDMINSFSRISSLRNDINHFGMRKITTPLEASKIKKGIEEEIKKVFTLLNIKS